MTYNNDLSRFNELIKITYEKNYEVSKYYSNIWDYKYCKHELVHKRITEYTKLSELIKQDINYIKHKISHKKNKLINSYEKLLQKVNKNDLVIDDNDNSNNIIFINGVSDITEDFLMYKLCRVYCKKWVEDDSSILLDVYNDNVRNLK